MINNKVLLLIGLRFSLILTALLSVSTLSRADVIPFGDIAVGLGVQTLEDTGEGAVSFLMKGGFGLQVLPFLSVQASLWGWTGDNYQYNGTTEEAKVVSFDGISASWEATFQIPFPNPRSDFRAGPYYRYGQQCWSAILSGLMQPWSGKGCNDLHAFGVVFPSSDKTRAAFYLEASQTNFDDLDSNAIQMGVKIPL
jgi:hypothetical protein